MSSNDITETAVKTDILVPTTTDGTIIQWLSDNPAEIQGLLDQIEKYLKRKKLLVQFITSRAAVIYNGKIAFDSVHSMQRRRDARMKER